MMTAQESSGEEHQHAEDELRHRPGLQEEVEDPRPLGGRREPGGSGSRGQGPCALPLLDTTSATAGTVAHARPRSDNAAR